MEGYRIILEREGGVLRAGGIQGGGTSSRRDLIRGSGGHGGNGGASRRKGQVVHPIQRHINGRKAREALGSGRHNALEHSRAPEDDGS